MTGRRKVQIISLLLVAAGLSAPLARAAATYYIDYAAGSDAAAGTSPDSAWRHSPGDAQATLLPAAASLAPGDRIVFKGGVRYKGSIRLEWSGSEAAPITYDGGADSGWGEGRAVLTSEHARDANDTWIAMRGARDVRHLVIRGFHFNRIGGYAEDDPVWDSTDPVSSPPDGSGIVFDHGGSHLLIEDCMFDKIGQWINAIPMSGAYSITGIGVYLRGTKHTEIRNCEFSRLRIGVRMYANVTVGDGHMGPVTVTGCRFFDRLVWGIDVAHSTPGSHLSDITIEHSDFYNYSQYDDGNWNGYGEKPHRDGIFLRNAGHLIGTWTNVVVRNCRFWDDDPGASGGGTASIYISGGPSVSIYNCVFLDDPQAVAAISVAYPAHADFPQRVLIANNTFITRHRPLSVAASANPAELRILNNLFYRRSSNRSDNAFSMSSTAIGNLVVDHNLYYADQPLQAWFPFYTQTFVSYEGWRAMGRDAAGLLANPRFGRLTGPPSGWDPEPHRRSPVRGAGTDLSDRFSVDLLGNARLGPWSIGAVHVPSPASVFNMTRNHVSETP